MPVLLISNFLKSIFPAKTFEPTFMPSSSTFVHHFSASWKLLSGQAPLFSHGSLKQMSFNHLCITVLFVPTLLKSTFTQKTLEPVCTPSSFKPSSPCRATSDWNCFTLNDHRTKRTSSSIPPVAKPVEQLRITILITQKVLKLWFNKRSVAKGGVTYLKLCAGRVRLGCVY